MIYQMISINIFGYIYAHGTFADGRAEVSILEKKIFGYEKILGKPQKFVQIEPSAQTPFEK